MMKLSFVLCKAHSNFLLLSYHMHIHLPPQCICQIHWLNSTSHNIHEKTGVSFFLCGRLPTSWCYHTHSFLSRLTNLFLTFLISCLFSNSASRTIVIAYWWTDLTYVLTKIVENLSFVSLCLSLRECYPNFLTWLLLIPYSIRECPHLSWHGLASIKLISLSMSLMPFCYHV